MESVLVNGNIEIVMNDKDIIDIVRECCGDDLAKLIENRLNVPLEENITPELIETILSKTDYASYEASLDEWNCAGNDIIEECEKQIDYIEESKRIDKNKLYNAFINISKIVSNIL